MSLIFRFLYRMENARLNPFGPVIGKPKVEGNLIRGLKSDSLDLPNDAVGIGFQNRLGRISIFSNQTKAEGIGDAISLKKHHHLPHCFLFFPCFPDTFYPLLPNAFHFP